MGFRTLKECIEENKGIEKNPKKYCEMTFPNLKQVKYSQPLKVPLNTVRDIIKQSRICSKKFPSLQNHKNACEVGIIPSKAENFTLHTHTHKQKIDYPSPRDVETTKKWKKKFLCIAESVTGRLICYSDKDNFMKPVLDRKVL